jgi:hypothetical protein
MLFLKKDGRENDLGPLDANVFGGVEHGFLPCGAGRARNNPSPLCPALLNVLRFRRITEDDLRDLAPDKLDAIRHMAR